MPKSKPREKMVRISIQLPEETRDEVLRLAEVVGVRGSAFMGLALIMGARQLARQAAPEQFMTAEVWRNLAQGMGVDGAQADQLKRLVSASNEEEHKPTEPPGFRPGSKPRSELEEEPMVPRGEHWSGYMRGL